MRTGSLAASADGAFTSASAARNSVEPNAGGASGRKALPDDMSQGRTDGHCGVTGVPNQNSGPRGMVSVTTASAPSALALAITSVATLRPIASPAVNRFRLALGSAAASLASSSSSAPAAAGKRYVRTPTEGAATAPDAER